MLMADEPLTLVHRVRGQHSDSYTTQRLTGSWYAQTVANTNTNGLQNASVVKVRTEDNVGGIAKGDKIVRGIVTDIDSSAFAALGRTHEAMTITEIHDNRRGLLPHIYIKGEG